jgi:hypothetical protein
MLRLFEYVQEHKNRDRSFLKRNLSYFEPVASDEHASDRFLKVSVLALLFVRAYPILCENAYRIFTDLCLIISLFAEINWLMLEERTTALRTHLGT